MSEVVNNNSFSALQKKRIFFIDNIKKNIAQENNNDEKPIKTGVLKEGICGASRY